MVLNHPLRNYMMKFMTVKLVSRHFMKIDYREAFHSTCNFDIGQIYAINKLPFIHVIMALDGNIIRAATAKEDLTDYLAQMFFGVLDAMFQQLRENSLPLSTSYNFLMTEDFIMLIPRAKENAVIQHNGKEFTFSLNSLAFAGLLLCKTQEELDALEAQDNLMDLLVQVGIKWNPDAAKFESERQAALDSALA